MATQETFPVILNIARQALAISDESVDELLTYFDRRNSIGVLVDPTAYIVELREARDAELVARTFAEFHRAIKSVGPFVGAGRN